MVAMLEPFETITRKISGATYSTLSLIAPYMNLLKKHFAPNEEENETFDTYLNLVYSSSVENSNIVSDDEYISSGGSRQYWQYSHRHQQRGNSQGQNRGQNRGQSQGQSQGRSHNRRRGRNPTSHQNEPNLDEINVVEYLQPVNTQGLLQKVRAAIFLSLDELWSVSSNIVLIATFLDPRFKTLDWCSNSDKNEAKKLVQELYNDAKRNLSPRNSISSDISSDDDNDIFKVLKNNDIENEDEDEVKLYLQQKQIKLKDDPLKWWSINKTTLPILAQIARKYLSIPATSVPSERLFSDAGNHISDRRTRLSSELVNKMLFLKRNSENFDIFPPLDL